MKATFGMCLRHRPERAYKGHGRGLDMRLETSGRHACGRTHAGRVVFLLALAIGAACEATEYRYPSGLSAKSLKTEVKLEPLTSAGAERHMRVLRAEVPDKQIKDTRPLGDVKLHVRQPDGSDLLLSPSVGTSTTYSGGGWALKYTTNVVFSWTPNFPGAQEGDIYPCYISYETGAKKWATREFSLKIGGSGSHMQCDKCFSIGMPPKTTLVATTAARMGTLGSTNGHGIGEEASSGSTPRIRVQDFLDGKEIKGRDVPLGNDILIYRLDALPREESLGQLKAGVTVHVVEEAAPSFVHVKFTTSTGRTYEGAAKIADLVPQHDLIIDVSTPMGPAPDPHQNELRLPNIPFSLVASGMMSGTLCVRCMRLNGTVQDLTIHGWSSSSSGYYSSSVSLNLDARPGDKYLCYIVCHDGQTIWVSQPFGLVCGVGIHSGCEKCFSFVPQKDVAILMETVLAAKKAKWAVAGMSEGGTIQRTGIGSDPGQERPATAGFKPRKVVLARNTRIYSLQALPQEQVLGTLRTGATLYVMDDLGGMYVRVRFTTPGGRSGEGAAKKSDLASSER